LGSFRLAERFAGPRTPFCGAASLLHGGVESSSEAAAANAPSKRLQWEVIQFTGQQP
jgi:hypothetical protein